MRLADRYRVLRRVGEGGGGGVWLVADRLANDAVMVLKRLNAQGQASLSQWLVNEFQILAQLDLPTVARVFDFGLAQADNEDPGGAFFTRAFVDGEPLDDAFAHDRADRSPEAIRAMFVSAATTLRELHRMGVVHGDLKPANLIVPRERDRVILIDFGLAHGALATTTHTRGGTLAYMPPERQARLFAGEALAPDPTADVYALAVSLRVVLLGGVALSPDLSPPAHVAASPPSMSLWEVASRGASEDPSRRFATVDDLLVALGAETDRARSRGARVVLRPEGRESELGVLLDVVARRLVRREAGVSAALLVGEEGSGRSTLLRELTWRAQLRGIQVLSVEGEAGDAPWQRLREGAEVLGGAPVDPTVPDALEAALRGATRHAPVLILADDLDRADPAIVGLLRSIAYGCEAGDALLVIATAEDAARVSELEAGVTVPLGALDEESVAALCQQVLGPLEPEVVRAIRARTEALPLRVIEMLAALAAEGAVTPADVESVEVTGRAGDVAARRVRGMTASVRDAAAAVAALGADADDASVRALVAGSAALATARAEGVVTVGADGRWSLTHPALEPALFAALDPTHARALLRRAAEVLDRTEVTETARARAWLRAGDATRAAGHVRGAVKALESRGLPLAAARLMEALRAVASGVVSPEALQREAELFHAAGVVGEARALAERVASGDGETAARGRLLLGRILRISGEIAEAERMLTALAAEGDGDLAAEAEVEAGRVAMLRGDYGAVGARCERAWTIAKAPRVRAAALGLAGVAATWSGDAEKGAGLLTQARGEYARLELPAEESGLLVYLGVGREQAGDLTGARALHEQSLEKARAAGDLRAMVTARINLGHIAQRLGDLGAALTHDEAALTLARRAGLRQAVLTARLNMASGLLRIGSLDRARAELDAARTQATAAGARDAAAAATLMLGNVSARAGEVDAGLGRVSEAIAEFEALGQHDDAVDGELDAAEILLGRAGAGDVTRAAEHLARGRRHTKLGLREARARMLEGRVMLARGDARGAIAALGEAITAAEANGDWEVHASALGARASAHLSTGAELHARRDRERAVEVLEAKGALLPPDLRGAFWSVSGRAALRSELSAMGQPVLGEVEPRGARRGLSFSMNVNAPTLIANDERLVLLLELSKRVGEEHTLERVLEQAVRSAVELTHAECGAILLAGEGGALETRVRRGAHVGEAPDEQFSRTIAETVWIDGEPVVTLNARGDRRFADFRSVHDLGIGAVAAVPIRAKGRALGVLYVENRQRRGQWTTTDVALMQAFAEQAGLAVDHARLVEELEARTRELDLARREIEALLVTRTHELEDTRKSLAHAQQELKRRFAPEGLVATTEPMRRLFAMIDRVKDSDVPVVIEGESGTGKELVARALHFSGARAKGPFVVVHCGAIPETLLESELFGHVKGAFTGADRDRKGLIASAHGGTLMLDEMAEMSPRMQVELLRVLQDRKVRPVGGEREESVEVRVVVASNRSLKDMVEAGRLREDLYYRLSVVTLRIPPLRERIEDVPALVNHFLGRFAEEHGGARKRVSRAAMEKLMRGQWPGNVRQLQHTLESAAVFAEGDEIPAEAFQIPTGAPIEPLEVESVAGATGTGVGAGGSSPSAARKASERQKILDALEQVNWNKVRAAQVLGMPRRTLYRRLREFGLLD